jgi:hypothetical protein
LILGRAPACIVIAAATLGASPAPQRNEIPAEYRGKWAHELRYCRLKGDTADSVLFVTATHVGHYGDLWRVTETELEQGRLRIAYSPRSDFVRYAPNMLRLSLDKSRIYTSDGSDDTGYKRCPKAKK